MKFSTTATRLLITKVDTFKSKKVYRQVYCEDFAKWMDSIVRFDSWQLG